MYFMQVVGNSDVTFYIIIVVLLMISIGLFYLLYSQNKEIEQKIVRNKDDSLKNFETVNIPQSPTAPKNENVVSDTNLQSITKELEQMPRERQVRLTPYEEEQEEKAIISYDELIAKSNNVSIGYSSTKQEDDVLVKQVDLSNTGKIELDPIKKELNSRVNVFHYEHEEAFLKALKQLQSLLN